MGDRESKSKREQRAREIYDALDRLHRGFFSDRVIGKWGTVSTERVARLKRSYWRELDEIRRADRGTFGGRSFDSYEDRAANLREIGLGADGKPLNEAACRTPGSLARWPQGRWGTDWVPAWVRPDTPTADLIAKFDAQKQPAASVARRLAARPPHENLVSQNAVWTVADRVNITPGLSEAGDRVRLLKGDLSGSWNRRIARAKEMGLSSG